MSLAACVEKRACLDCGSSDSLQVYLNIDEALGIEWYTSFCHSACWEQKGDPYKGGSGPTVHVKSEAEKMAEVRDVQSCKLFQPKGGYRGIPTKFYTQWGIRLLLSEFDGSTPYAIGFPYSDYSELVGWKVRPLHKKDFFALGRTANVDVFGLKRAFQIGGDTLWITEGEFDAIALDYCLSLAGDKGKYPVVSLTAGGGSMAKNLNYIEDRVPAKFKNIVLVLDDDEVGKLAEETALDMWDNIYIVSKPEGSKDANDAVENGDAKLMGTLALNFKD